MGQFEDANDRGETHDRVGDGEKVFIALGERGNSNKIESDKDKKNERIKRKTSRSDKGPIEILTVDQMSRHYSLGDHHFGHHVGT